MESTKILHCPFCGSDVDDSDSIDLWNGSKLYWLFCSCCEATGPKCRTKEIAIGEWNTRDERNR